MIHIKSALCALCVLASPLEAQKTERDTSLLRKEQASVASPSQTRNSERSGLKSDGAMARERGANILAAGRERVMQMLRDPESARFQGLFEGYDRKKREIVVCGEVNAKNGLGGYVGFVPFYSSQTKTELGGRDGGFFFVRRFNEFCRR